MAHWRTRETNIQHSAVTTTAFSLMNDSSQRTLFIDMSAGVAGDMLLAALLDLSPGEKERQHLIAALTKTLHNLLRSAVHHTKTAQAKPIPEPELTVTVVSKLGIRALAAKFSAPPDDWSSAAAPAPPTSAHHHTHNHHHPHDHHHSPARSYRYIKNLLAQSSLSPSVKSRALTVFTTLGKAEAKVHQTKLEDIHFHEVGSIDAICEIVGVCWLLEHYQLNDVTASAFVLGSGSVRCAHGTMPVPVPAVTEMLAATSAPIRHILSPTGELSTPTGVALVLSLAHFPPPSPAHPLPPVQTLIASGWGAGTKNFKSFPNILRVILSSIPIPASAPPQHAHIENDSIIQLQSNLDDASGEQLGLLMETLLHKGAYDVFFTPIIMKQSRPATCVTVLVPPALLPAIEQVLFSLSPTIGYRYQTLSRRKLKRHAAVITISATPIAVKITTLPNGSTQMKPEAASLRQALQTLPYSYHELSQRLQSAYREQTTANPSKTS